MLNVEIGASVGRRVLKKLYPDEKFTFASFKDTTREYDTWVFRCKAKGSTSSLVCKLSTPDDIGRARIKNQFDCLISANRNAEAGLFSVPKAIAFFEQDCTMIMEYVEGVSLRDKLGSFPNLSDAVAELTSAGRWIAAFQHPTRRDAEFEPKSHTNTLIRKMQSHREGKIIIPAFDSFQSCFQLLEGLALKARGQPCLRCVTHRDFHAGNLVVRSDGSVVGIDFENLKEDEALRDVMSFFFDMAIRWRGA